MTATPKAPPSWRMVENVPEAVPVSAGGTLLVTDLVTAAQPVAEGGRGHQQHLEAQRVRGQWERPSTPERGVWLAEHGFRATANKERVVVSRGEIEGQAELPELERKAPAQDKEPVYWGKCG